MLLENVMSIHVLHACQLLRKFYYGATCGLLEYVQTLHGLHACQMHICMLLWGHMWVTVI